MDTKQGQDTQNKEKKPVVSRFITYREQNASKKRIITVYYEYTRATKTLKYGAVIHTSVNNAKKYETNQNNFSENSTKESTVGPVKYDKRGHLNTATTRFNKFPITIKNFVDENNMEIFHHALRAQIHAYGVQQKKNSGIFEMAKVPTFRKKDAVKPVEDKKVEQTVSIKEKKVKKQDKQEEIIPIVTKVINFKETCGPVKRRIVIEYEHDRTNKTLKYGATIHKTSINHAEPYNNDAHKETAHKRFTNSPVVISDFPYQENQKLFDMQLRKLLFDHGVRASLL